MSEKIYSAGILTISDKGSTGEREDTSGPAIQDLLSHQPLNISEQQIVPDERGLIADILVSWADDKLLHLIITTGGTGLSERDVTPQATESVIDYRIPGIEEAMRANGMRQTPFAMLSRLVVGVRNGTLIINLPGSEKAVTENLQTIMPVLSHALGQINGHKDADSH